MTTLVAATVALLCATPWLLGAHQLPGNLVATALPWSPRIDYLCGTSTRLSVWYESGHALLYLEGRLERFAAVRGAAGRYSNGLREWTARRGEAWFSAVGQSQQSRQQCQLLPLSAWRQRQAPRRFICTDGLAVEVTATLEAAALGFRGDTYRLREVPAGRGTLYTDGVREWRGPADSRMFAEAQGNAVFARGCTPGVADDPASITGTITQPRRQPLPAESVVEARLVEESRDAALAAVVARSVQLASGEPGPVPFTLTYAPTALEGGRRYLVQVTIATAGRVRFQGNTSSPVGENGALAGPIQIAVEPVR